VYFVMAGINSYVPGDMDGQPQQFAGGYLSSPTSASGSGKKQSSPGDGKKVYSNQSLTPVTIKMLNDAAFADSKFKIDNHELNQITFVGAIVSLEVQQTRINMMIADGSGAITVNHFIDDGQQAQTDLKEATYVRVYGNLRNTGGKMVTAFRILPLVDCNEINFHMLEVIKTHLFHTRGPPGSRGQAGAASYSGASSSSSSSAASAPRPYGHQPPGSAYYPAPSSVKQESYHAPPPAHADPRTQLNTQVLRMFQDDERESQITTAAADAYAGSPLQSVISRFSGRFSERDIREAATFLAGEGLLYSTTDEETYRCTSQESYSG